MTETFEKKLLDESDQLGIHLSKQQQEQLFRYYELLVEKNKVMNLTAITEEGDVITKHFIDSMAIINVSRETFTGDGLNGKSLIDIGTGAGFPGLVLKILFPELSVCLSDSLMKRLKFLDEVIEELKLKDIRTVHGRAEDLGHDKSLRESFDFAVSRAVANLSTLSEYDLPFVKVNGYFFPMKAGNMQDEMKEAERAISILGGKIEGLVEYTLPNSDIERTVLSIRKAKECPKIYPRKAGTPSKNPLK